MTACAVCGRAGLINGEVEGNEYGDDYPMLIDDKRSGDGGDIRLFRLLVISAAMDSQAA